MEFGRLGIALAERNAIEDRLLAALAEQSLESRAKGPWPRCSAQPQAQLDFVQRREEAWTELRRRSPSWAHSSIT